MVAFVRVVADGRHNGRIDLTDAKLAQQTLVIGVRPGIWVAGARGVDTQVIFGDRFALLPDEGILSAG